MISLTTNITTHSKLDFQYSMGIGASSRQSEVSITAAYTVLFMVDLTIFGMVTVKEVHNSNTKKSIGIRKT
jgi:hypothetical protein